MNIIWSFLLLLLDAQRAAACTTLAVGKKASASGFPMVSHSDDGESRADARLCYVPAASYPPNSTRTIYFSPELYPRFVGEGRGNCYMARPGQTPFTPIGEIPQVSSTYAYYEATYGVMNEHGLGAAESTCSGRLGARAKGHGGNALLSMDVLTQIAMERSKKAREAVQLMGNLSETYGFYGAGQFEGSAESLLIGDTEEVFIFHVLPDPSGNSSIWAAQRLPDDHVTVVANMFIIREINFNDTEQFMFSKNLKSVAEDKGWWTKGTPFDFTLIYSDGEYSHKFYSGRRVWGAYRLYGLELPDDYVDLRKKSVYPVSAKPNKTVELSLLFKLHRDYYQDTKYDMTKGLAAGPWGDPDRYAVDNTTNVTGSWERSIGLYRTTTTHVVQMKSGGQGSVLWFGPHATSTTCFVPIPASAGDVPMQYQVADPDRMFRASAYWAHRYVSNVAKLKYKYTIKIVQKAQGELEQTGELLVQRWDSLSVGHETVLEEIWLHANRIVETFWSLPDEMIEKYADGWLDDGRPMGYPDWWLHAVGYENGPPPPPSQPIVQVAPEFRSHCDLYFKSCVDKCGSDGFADCAAACLQSDCPHTESMLV